MRKITIKVKHIIITLGVMFVLVPILLLAAGSALYNSGSRSLRSYSNVFLSLYTGFPKPSAFNGEVYFKLGETTFNISRNRTFIRNDGSYSHPEEARSREYLYKAIECFEKGMKMGEKDKYYTSNYNRAIALHTLAGDKDKVESLIETGLKSDNENVRLNAARNQVVFDIKNRRYSEALEKCNAFLKIWKDDYLLHTYSGDLSFLLGDVERAKTEYIKGRKPLKQEGEDGLIDYPSGNREGFIENRRNGDGSGIIKGRVVNGEKAIPYALVMLEEELAISGEIMGLSGLNSGGFNFADEQGYYEIKNVPRGRYILRLVVPGIAVENVSMVINSDYANRYTEIFSSEVTEKNIEFRPNIEMLQSGIIEPEGDALEVEWKPVKDAVRYIVSLETSYENNFEKKDSALVTSDYISVNENKIRLQLNDGSISSIVFLPAIKDDGNPTTSSYIGYVDGREIGVYISAVDKDGRIISKTSRDSKPVIKGRKPKLNSGEKLILEGKLVQGKEWFEENLKDNPENKNALYNLIRIYSFGIRGEYKDENKAKEYAERIYKLNGDKYEYEHLINVIMNK